MSRPAPRLREVGPRVYLRVRWVRLRRWLADFYTEPGCIFALLFFFTATAVVSATFFFPEFWLLLSLWGWPEYPDGGLYGDREFIEGVLVEAHGMLLDMLILGIVFSLIYRLGLRKLEVRRFQNEIRDLASWGSEEAKRRIAGHVRRLNRHGVNDVDLRDAVLVGADLGPRRVDELPRPVPVGLRGSSLHRADLRGVDLRRADLRDANFYRVKLAGARLDQADLRGARNLSIRQLLAVASLRGAQLDALVLERMRKRDAKCTAALLGEAE